MIQSLAYIHPEAQIGADVVIEPFAMIHKDVIIGDGTWVGSHAVINDGARIGRSCKIYPGAVVSAVPQDLKYQNEVTHTYIGDNTIIREYATISRGTDEHWKTEVGSNCLVMAYAHIAHDCRVGNNCIVGNNVQVAGHVHIGDWAIVSALSAVHQFVKIGSHAFIAGASLVRKDVPPFVKAAREPLSYAGINSVGLRRRGFSGEQILDIQNIYRYLYMQNLNNTDAIALIEEEIATSSVRSEIIEFVRASERGIIKSPFQNHSSQDSE